MDAYNFCKINHKLPLKMTEDDILQLQKDWSNIKDIQIKPNTAVRKSTIKKGIAYGIKFDSHWEYIFYKYMREIKGFAVERNKSVWLPYIGSNGKQRKFFPDFSVAGTFYEVKGRWTDNDTEKMRQCPQVNFCSGPEIQSMKQELDKKLANWDEDFIQTQGGVFKSKK